MMVGMAYSPTLALLPVVVVLVVVNLLNNRLAPRAYVPTSLTATGLLLLLFRYAGLGWADAGLGLAGLGPGVAWGLAGLILVAVGYLIGTLLPASRDWFSDRRVEHGGRGAAAYQVLVRIPFGTVLLEEVAFRGVLYGIVLVEYGAVWATAVSCAMFGLWHLLPALPLTRLNRAAGRAFGRRPTVAVAIAVLASALAGLVLCELRRYSGSLLAPVTLHWATNGLGYLTARLLVSRRARPTTARHRTRRP
jgi:CAAX protease family protein